MKLHFRKMIAFTGLLLVPLLCMENNEAFSARTKKVVKVKKKKIVKKKRLVKNNVKPVKKKKVAKKNVVKKKEEKPVEKKVETPKLEVPQDPNMLTIPYGVKTLKDIQYAGTKFKEVYIHDGVTRIGNLCFANCQDLASIRLPQNMIGGSKNILNNTANLRIDVPRHARILQDGKNYHMIVGTNIHSLGNIENPRFVSYEGEDKCVVDLSKEVKLFLPLGLNKVPAGAFASTAKNTGNVNLVDRTGTVQSIEFAAFENCGWLDSIDVPDIKRIAKMAFFGSNLSNFSIPNFIEHLEDNCFGGCENLKKLTIPNDAQVFVLPSDRSCWLKRSSGVLYRIAWNIPEGVKFFNHHEEEVKESKIASLLKGVINIPEFCFAETTEISEVSIPDSVMTISEQAFYKSEVRVISIPSTVVKLGKLAFSYCRKLNEVKLPNTMTWRQIENDCFLGSDNAKVYIGKNMEKDFDQIRRVGLKMSQVIKE